MGQGWLKRLALLHIHKETEVGPKEGLDELKT